ncbi:MAG: protein-L-isoaspartate O-methyltransferase [Salaquimonas sp.]
MLDYKKIRQNMVDCQIRTNDVTNHALLDAFLQVPRERFVPKGFVELAYIDEDIAVGSNRYLMEPAPFAKLAQAVGIGPDDVVLDVGCNSGYSSAVFSRFASVVIALEENSDLARQAATTLDELDYDNVAVVEGPLNLGYASEGPYNVIFVNGAVDEIPEVLFDQLKDGGKLITVLGHGNSAVAKMYSKSGSDISGRNLFNCAVEPLPGFAKEPVFVL